MSSLSSFPRPAREDQESVQGLAQLRYQLRRFLASAENAERQFGITPRQLQLLLGVAGFTGRGRASVSELAEFLQEKHNSVVGLIDRAEHSGLVQRETDSSDRRFVLVSLTERGKQALASLLPSQWEKASRLREKLAAIEAAPRQEQGRTMPERPAEPRHEHQEAAGRRGLEESQQLWACRKSHAGSS